MAMSFMRNMTVMRNESWMARRLSGRTAHVDWGWYLNRAFGIDSDMQLLPIVQAMSLLFSQRFSIPTKCNILTSSHLKKDMMVSWAKCKSEGKMLRRRAGTPNCHSLVIG